jgi:hypothetical protein
MNSTEYILTVILVMTIATFATRIMPFLFFMAVAITQR